MIPIFDNNPTTARPVVTKALLWANVLGLALSFWLEGQGVTWLSASYGMVPARLALDPLGEWPKILTSMFLHGGFWHLVWNMWFLHIFGDNVEEALGKGRYLLFYVLSGVAAALGQFFINPGSHVPMIGASGAIAGVLGAYLVLFPRAPVSVLNPVFPLWFIFGPFFVLPAWFVVGEWFLGNVFGGLANLGTEGEGIAFFAHLGGFIFGLLAIRPFTFLRRVRARDAWSGFRAEKRAPRPNRRVFWKDDGGPFWK